MKQDIYFGYSLLNLLTLQISIPQKGSACSQSLFPLVQLWISATPTWPSSYTTKPGGPTLSWLLKWPNQKDLPTLLMLYTYTTGINRWHWLSHFHQWWLWVRTSRPASSCSDKPRVVQTHRGSRDTSSQQNLCSLAQLRSHEQRGKMEMLQCFWTRCKWLIHDLNKYGNIIMFVIILVGNPKIGLTMPLLCNECKAWLWQVSLHSPTG